MRQRLAACLLMVFGLGSCSALASTWVVPAASGVTCRHLVQLNSCILWPFAACGKAGTKEAAVGTPLVCLAKSSASHNQRRF